MGNVLVATLSTFSVEDREQRCIKVAASIGQLKKNRIDFYWRISRSLNLNDTKVNQNVSDPVFSTPCDFTLTLTWQVGAGQGRGEGGRLLQADCHLKHENITNE